MLAINVALILFIVLSPPGLPRREKARPMKDHIGNQLGFNDKQKETFEKMVKSHREQIREIEMEERVLIKAYFKNLTIEEQGVSSDSLLSKIMFLKGERTKSTFQHLEELKGLCTEEQLEKYDKVMQRVIPRLTGSRGRPGNRPPGDR